MEITYDTEQWNDDLSAIASGRYVWVLLPAETITLAFCDNEGGLHDVFTTSKIDNAIAWKDR